MIDAHEMVKIFNNSNDKDEALESLNELLTEIIVKCAQKGITVNELEDIFDNILNMYSNIVGDYE